MNESQITLVLAVLAILATAGLLFRLGALGGKAMLTVFVSTTSLAGFLYWTLIPS
ncbi:MAG: hypothetical protein H7Y60_03665 [Rhodospirillaceae bacterium]|nr:hypothetical protein [Rhodospirillales bacterium]